MSKTVLTPSQSSATSRLPPPPPVDPSEGGGTREVGKGRKVRGWGCPGKRVEDRGGRPEEGLGGETGPVGRENGEGVIRKLQDKKGV